MGGGWFKLRKIKQNVEIHIAFFILLATVIRNAAVNAAEKNPKIIEIMFAVYCNFNCGIWKEDVW